MQNKQEVDKIGEELERDINATHSTQGYDKLWNYFLAVVKSGKFQNEILKLRRQYKIPEKGLDYNIWYDLNTGLPAKGTLKEVIITPIMNWERCNPEGAKTLWGELFKLCRQYRLHYLEWEGIIERYFFYNELDDRKSYEHPNAQNLCLIADLAGHSSKHNSAYPFTEERDGKLDNEIYPVAIRISPYASKRDILDFVNKMFPAIKTYQNIYIKPEVKIGKIKKKNPKVQERNEFIYQNRKLSLNETKKLVEEKFGESLDYEYIGKIRSEEAKKRKKV